MGRCNAVLAAHCGLPAEALERACEDDFARLSAEESPPFPGVIELCRHICAGGGKNVIVTHRWRRSTMELLAVHGMAGYFAGCITRDDGYPRKPDPAAFVAALAAYELQPEETLTVGDRDIDILAGQAAGLWGCFCGAEPDGARPDLVIGSFAELHRCLMGGGAIEG